MWKTSSDLHRWWSFDGSAVRKKQDSYLACFAAWSSFQNSIRLISLFSTNSPWSPHSHTLRHTLTRSVTPYPLSQGESELHTCSTVPWMMWSPTGKRMPPRMATTAPNTAPAISPHLLLQQPMVVCLSLLPLRVPVSWLPVLPVSVCVACAAVWLCVCVPGSGRKQHRQCYTIGGTDWAAEAR